MLEDVIELRLNKWVPRRKDDNPKTIKEIHREAEEKDLISSATSSAILNQRGGQRSSMSRSSGGTIPLSMIMSFLDFMKH